MPRHYRSSNVFLKPDPKYSSRLLSKFINCFMVGGKKTTAENMVYGALDILKKRFPDQNELDTFLAALNNIKPHVEVRSRRVGGATYQVPVQVSRARQTALAIRWIRETSRARKGKPMATRLADELSDAYKGEGNAVKKRENVHRMADANKAFAHYASW
jgi:small subunit ribosomal protein S7